MPDLITYLTRCLPVVAQCAAGLVAILSVVPLFAASYDVLFGGDIVQSLVGDDDDPCTPGMELQVDESCMVAPIQGRFLVVENGANPPGEARLAKTMIKIDWGASNHTFQTAKVRDGGGAWRIEAAGLWLDVGSRNGLCREGDEIQPGQFCTEPNTRKHFRVYATDELGNEDREIQSMCPTGNGDDCRPLNAKGYGVLFLFGPESKPALDRIPNKYNGRLDEQRISCVDPDTGATMFIAERQASKHSKASSDAWKIITAEEEANGVLDCMSKQKRSEQ